MRITNKMITNRYTRQLNKNMSTLNELAEKAETGKKFNKGSQDPIGAVKSYRLRREYCKNEDYLINLQEADSILTTAESNLMGISKSLDTVYTSYLKGITGTMGKDEREIISTELGRIQESIVTTLNSKFNEKYTFGGTSMETPPFTLNGGELYYKGVNVSIANQNAAVGTPERDAYDALVALEDEKFYLDLGLSLNVQGGNVNENSVFNIAMPGIGFMGFGKTEIDGQEIPNNLYDLIGDLRKVLEDDNFSIDKISPYIKNFENQKKQVLHSVTTIGTKTNYVDFLKTRTEDNNINLNKKILDVGYVDPAEAIMDWKMQEYSYRASLQMGNKIMQPSFIDFMN